MKPMAHLINTSRGAVVNTEALCQALTQGLLAGAALDVTEPEPINMDNPILKLDNVIITAHSAGASPMAMTELWRRPVEEMINVLIKKQWPRGLVNPRVKEKYLQKWGLNEPSPC
jgi:D-3-phosphoglycerate dehydrogenase